MQKKHAEFDKTNTIVTILRSDQEEHRKKETSLGKKMQVCETVSVKCCVQNQKKAFKQSQ